MLIYVSWFLSILREFFFSLPFLSNIYVGQDSEDGEKENEREGDGDGDGEYTYNKEEEQYLELAQHILENGTDEMTRNGETRNIFGATLRFSLQNGQIPLLTTKRVAWKTALKELLWMIRGQTHNDLLQEQGVHIWDGNSTREFLDKSGLEHYEEGELGPVYGWQMRRFNAKYTCCREKRYGKRHTMDSYKDKDEETGVDQLQYVIDLLKNPETRSSRRIVMSYWNPCQLEEMALPPCHCFVQFHVSEGTRLSCALTMRSNDLFLGQPFNIASYCFLTHLLAKHCDLEAHEFCLFVGDCHIYKDHFGAVLQQLSRNPLPFPLLNIREKKDRIEDYDVEDFVVIDYQHHSPLYAPMAA